MKIYIGRWSANGSSTYGAIEGRNTRKMAKTLRKIVEGNVFAGNTGSWDIVEKGSEDRGYYLEDSSKSGTVRN